jgi:hypothetical protein
VSILLLPGRRDDLWSWLYIMVEMITGTLPWRSDEGRDREQVHHHSPVKQQACRDVASTLTTQQA